MTYHAKVVEESPGAVVLEFGNCTEAELSVLRKKFLEHLWYWASATIGTGPYTFVVKLVPQP